MADVVSRAITAVRFAVELRGRFNELGRQAEELAKDTKSLELELRSAFKFVCRNPERLDSERTISCGSGQMPRRAPESRPSHQIVPASKGQSQAPLLSNSEVADIRQVLKDCKFQLQSINNQLVLEWVSDEGKGHSTKPLSCRVTHPLPPHFVPKNAPGFARWILTRVGYRTNERNKDGYTALHLVCGEVVGGRNRDGDEDGVNDGKLSRREIEDLLEMLLGRGANGHAQTPHLKDTFLHIATNSGHTFLLRCAEDYITQSEDGVDAKGNERERRIESGKMRQREKREEWNELVWSTNRKGWMLLHTAAAGGQVGPAKVLIAALRTIKTDNYPLIDTPDYDGCTPLHLAAKGSHKDMVSLLPQRGANPKVQDYDERTQLDVARKNDDKACAAIIEEAMKRKRERKRTVKPVEKEVKKKVKVVKMAKIDVKPSEDGGEAGGQDEDIGLVTVNTPKMPRRY